MAQKAPKIKVRDLIALLQELPPNAMVVMSKDGEGNVFEPWSGDFGHGYYTPEHEFIDLEALKGPECEYSKDDIKAIKKDSKKAVVLWPEN